MNHDNLKKLIGAVVVAHTLLLNGCTTTATDSQNSAATQINKALASSATTVAGEYLSAYQGGWLSISSQQPLSMNGTVVDDIRGEYLDMRIHNQVPTWLTMNNQRQLVLIQHQQESWSSSTSAPVSTALEGLCLYQPAHNQPLQAFLLGEDHQAQQVLLQPQGDTLTVTPLRTLPLPPASEFCAVDDAEDVLYVTEEHIGVWRYSARMESEIRRQPLALVAPNGPLQEVGPLAMNAQRLWMVSKGGHELYQFEQHQLNQRWQLDDTITADGLALQQQTQHISAMVLNERDEQWHAVTLPNQSASASINKIPELPATGETTPVPSIGDASDDPAIWVHPKDGKLSRILGTDKQRGLFVYDLSGEQQQALMVGRVNNVDVRQGFSRQGQAMDIAAASQRDRAAISLFAIDPNNGQIRVAEEILTTLDDVYGLCMYRGKNEALYVFINDEDGRYEQWQILDQATGWQGKKVREFALNSQPEGCSGDDARQQLFLGEENVALYVMNAEPNASTDLHIIGRAGDDWLTADIEGMEVFDDGNNAYLLVSSQGNDSYVLYSATAPYQPLTRFRIGMNLQKHIDGASETDGLTVSSANFGPGYEHGLIVVQDGRNLMPKQTQNFKLVSWQQVKQLFPQQ